MKKIYKKEIIDDIKKVYNEQNDSSFKTYKLYGRFSPSTVDKNFGNWSNALKEIGIENKHIRLITKEELKKDLIKTFKETNSTKQNDYSKNGKYSREVVKRIYGSWNKMLKELNFKLNMFKPGQYSEEDIINSYLKIKKDLGKAPSAKQFRKLSEFSQSIIDKTFGSFSNLKRKMNDIVDARFVSDEEIEEKVLELFNTYGIISSQVLLEELNIVSYPTILTRYGSVKKLCSKLNIPYEDKSSRSSKFSIACINYISEKLGNEFETEKTFPWLINPSTGYHLYLDMYYDKLKLAIEFDGIQHSTIIKDNIYCPHNESELNRIKEKDRTKDNLLKEHNIKIIRIKKLSKSLIDCLLEDVI